jgi:hypothetical protein
VHFDGKPVRPCMLPVGAVRDRAVTTIEGVGATPVGAKAQKAWLDLEVIQCGYCQSGQIVSVAALLATTPNPDAKPGERFQPPSPKAVVLPSHHSPTDYRTNSISYGIVRQLSTSATLNDRRSIRGDLLFASDRSWQARLRGGFCAARPATLNFKRRPFRRAAGAAALFHDERRHAPMAMVASCRSSVDDDRSASPTTTKASPAYPAGNGRGIHRQTV